MQTNKLKWSNYVSAFLAGAFLANTLPHYVQGISGHPFPSPFGDPPGLGLSSPTINVLWGAFNLLVGYFLFRFSRIDKNQSAGLITMFFGITAMGVVLSLAFSQKL